MLIVKRCNHFNSDICKKNKVLKVGESSLNEPGLIKRYCRNIMLPGFGLEGQKSLNKASVLIIGAGGLGCPVIQYLTAAGVGKIGIVDDDIIEETNLQRQVLYTSDDLGKAKAISAAARAIAMNPLIIIKSYQQRLTSQNALDTISEYDVIVDATDNFPARFLINDACVIKNKPWVYGAVEQYEGQVSVFNYKNGPTYRCLVKEYPDTSESLNCAEAGVLGAVTGIIGSIMAIEVIKILTDSPDVLSGTLLSLDTLTMEQHKFCFVRDHEINVSELLDYETLCNSVCNDVRTPVINREQLEEWIALNQSLKLIDLRDPREIGLSTLPSSINIPFEEFWNQPFIPDNDEKVVFICTLGIKSRIITRKLIKEFGCTNVYSLDGGVYL